MSSTLTVTNLTATNLTDGSGTTSTFANISQGHAKAWVNFDQYSTNSIRDSYNVSSVSDDSAGKHTITFNNSMSNTSYIANVTASNHVNHLIGCTQSGSAFAAASVQVTTNTTTAFGDNERACTAVNGDLA